MGRDGDRIARRALFLLLVLMAVSPAHAQDQDKKKKRPQASAPAAAPQEPAPAPTPLLRPVPPPQLSSAVRSLSSQPAVIGRSTTAQCRARCSEQRLSCQANPEDTSGCNPNWTQCLSGCAGLGYGRATQP